MTEAMVEIRSLERRFGDKQALDDVTLDIPAGVVFGLVGENGAGKTTLLKHLLGLLRPSAGSVRVFGLDPVAEPARVLGQIGYLSEDRDLPLWMRIDQLMHYTSAFYPHWDHDYAAELVQMFELPKGQRLKTLSRGQLARVGLLLAIAHRPPLLLLDEPSSGLDPLVRRDILSAIIRTVADDGRTVLFSSHLLDEVQRVSDHVAMLHQGRLLLCDALDAVLQQHSRWTIRLPEPLQDAPVIPGALSCQGAGTEWSLVCNGRQEETEAWLNQVHGEVVERARPSLDEIFISRVGGEGTSRSTRF
ncbi:MAG: ABC transporter ATP-binding protein [Fuerstiella sp.]